jgi:hypothetical protein
MSRRPGTYIELDAAWDDPGWTRVPNSIARCNTISRRVKGWILEVASHAPGRRLTVAEMLKCSTDGRDATYATIKEAMAAGFVTRHQDRGQYGRMGAVVYRIHVTQQTTRSEPLPDSPYAVEPVPGNPESKNQKTRNPKDQRSKQCSAAAEPSPPTAETVKDQNNACSASAPPPRGRGDGPPQNQDPQTEGQPDDDVSLWETLNYPSSPAEAARIFTPAQLTEYGKVEKAARLTELIERWFPEVLQSNNYHAIESMIEQGAPWQKILRKLLNDHGGYAKDDITRYIAEIGAWSKRQAKKAAAA